MAYSSAKEIHKAIKDNISIIQSLFQNAKDMQKSIADLQSDEDKEIMTQNFNKVVQSINDLIKSTDDLFDLLESVAED